MDGKGQPSTKTDSKMLYSYKWLRDIGILYKPLLDKLIIYLQTILRYDGHFVNDKLTWQHFADAYRIEKREASEMIKNIKTDADFSDVVVSEPQGDYDDDEDVDDD